MKSAIVTISLILALAILLVPISASAQNFDRLLDALTRLENTLKTLKAQAANQSTQTPVMADAEGGVVSAPASTLSDDALVVASQLTEVVTEMKQVVEDTKKAESARPKNPTSSSHGKITLYGVAHGSYYQREGASRSSNFEMRTVQLGANGSLNDWAKYQFIGEFAKSPSLLDAKITVSPSKQISFEAGQYKPPFCTDNLRATTAMPFVTASMAKALGPSRDAGISAGYNRALTEKTNFKIVGGVYNGAAANTSDANRDKNLMSRAEFAYAKNLTLAANILTGTTNAVDSLKQNVDSWGGSATWSWNKSIVEAEFIHTHVGTTDKAGWYLWGGQSFVTGSRFVPEVQLLARWEQLDNNRDITGNRTSRIVLGTNLYIDGKFTKLQFNYNINGEQTNEVSNNEALVNLQLSF